MQIGKVDLTLKRNLDFVLFKRAKESNRASELYERPYIKVQMKHHYLDAQLESGGEQMISYSFEHVKVLDVFFQYSEHFTVVFCKLEICYWLIEKNVTCLYL